MKFFPGVIRKKLLTAMPASSKCDFKKVWSDMMVDGEELDSLEIITALKFYDQMIQLDFIDGRAPLSNLDVAWVCSVSPKGLAYKTQVTSKFQTVINWVTIASLCISLYLGYREISGDNGSKRMDEINESIIDLQREAIILQREIDVLNDRIRVQKSDSTKN